MTDAGGRVMDAGGRVMDAGGRVMDAAGRVMDAGGWVMDAGTRAICRVARRDVRCRNTRCLLWQDKTSVVARDEGGGLRPPPQRGAAAFGGRRPSWFPCVLPQQRSCLAKTDILPCHSAHLAVPHQRSIVARQDARVAIIIQHASSIIMHASCTMHHASLIDDE